MSLAGTGDAARSSWPVAGLAHARVETEIADQLASAREATDLADDRDQRERGDRPNAKHSHQPTDLWARQRFPGKLSLGTHDLGAERIVQAQVAVDLLARVDRQHQLGQPERRPARPGRPDVSSGSQPICATACP